MKKGQSNWLENHLRQLAILDKEIQEKLETKSGVANEFMNLTPLKLIFYKYVFDIYTRIMPKCGWAKHIYYVDLFSGSGVNKIEDELSFIGSPLMAASEKFNKFEKLFFLDVNDAYCKALERRLNVLGVKNKEIVCYDCNTYVDKIIAVIGTEDSHSLVIIDPYSMEIKWGTLAKFLNVNSDIILTFQSRQVARAVGKAIKGGGGDKIITDFFGDESWKGVFDNGQDAAIEEFLKKIYVEKIIRTRANPVMELIYINGESFGYYLIFITRRTAKDNPWMDGIRQGKQEVEKRSSELVGLIVDILSGKQKKLF